MNRVSKYQENIQRFIQTKSFIKSTTIVTQNILNNMLGESDHIPAILCLTILNYQCKKYNIRIHGYYIALCIDILMVICKLSSNRSYYDEIYGANNIDNMISEIINWIYWSIFQNIETLEMNKTDKFNPKTAQLCIEYCIKFIPLITKKIECRSNITNNKMKKTDMYHNKINDVEFINTYKQKQFIDRETLNEIYLKFGYVCCLAMYLGWTLGQGDDATVSKFDSIGMQLGIMLKIHNDFKHVDRDIHYGKYSTNCIINCGIKESYAELIESKINFIEMLIIHSIDTNTLKEIIEIIMTDVDNCVASISVDLESQFDDCSAI